MLTCKQASMLISQGLDRRLGIGERLGLMIHLFMCDACSRVRGQLDLLRRATKRWESESDDGGTLPPEIRERILDRLRSHM